MILSMSEENNKIGGSTSAKASRYTRTKVKTKIPFVVDQHFNREIFLSFQVIEECNDLCQFVFLLLSIIV